MKLDSGTENPNPPFHKPWNYEFHRAIVENSILSAREVDPFFVNYFIWRNIQNFPFNILKSQISNNSLIPNL